MKKSLSWYKEEAQDMLEADTERDNKFRAMDAYYRGEWNVPEKFKNVDWFHSIVDMGPHDALYAAARTLATLDPRPTYHPLDSTPETRARADLIERVLLWHYWRANRRSIGRVTWDIVMSALMYDEVAFQVVYHPWLEKLGGRKGKLWEPGGDFSFNVHNPQNVHSVRTAYGLERVLVAKVLTVDEVCKTWGDYARKFEQAAMERKYRYCQYFEFMDDTQRVAWVTATTTDLKSTPQIVSETAAAEEFLIFDEPHELPFMPWVARMGGSGIHAEPENQRHPLLDPIYRAKMWDTSNMLQSLKISTVIANVGQPKNMNITMDGQPPEIDMSQPGGEVTMRPGESRQPLPPPPIDSAILQTAEEMSQRIASSTLPKILQDPSAGNQMAFATFNASFNAAGNSLDPHRMLAENALADGFTQMLYWCIHARKNLYAWDTTSKEGRGREMVVRWDELEPESIYISVKLDPKLPIDKVSQLNAGMLLKNLGVPMNRILEQLNITDPEVVMDEAAQEALDQAELGKIIKRITAEGDAEAQAILQAAQMQAQQEAMAAQQPPQEPQAGTGNPLEMLAQGPAGTTEAESEQQAMARALAGMAPDQAAGIMQNTFGNASGQGFNPAMGGQSPTEMAPGIGREQIRGRDRGGQPL